MDKDGKLSAEDQSKIAGWLNDKAITHTCPVCGANDWMIGDYVVGLPIANSRYPLRSSVYPAVIMTCRNCAYVRQFLARGVGIDTSAIEPEQGDA